MSPADLLLAARDLIADPEHWTKGATGRTAEGRDTRACAEDAASWCMAGAAIHAGAYEADTAYTFMEQAVQSRGFRWVTHFNDAPETTHTDVLDAFDRAIRLAKDES